MRPSRNILAVFAILMGGLTLAQAQSVTSSEFTYQGRLDFQGQPYIGGADYRFSLWSAATGGEQIGSTAQKSGVQVQDGLFTVNLDFGPNAVGQSRWLEIAVRTPAWDGSGTEPDFFTLSQRQPITNSPYSVHTRGIFVNEAGDRVAIGTQSPTHTLHVAGSSKNTALLSSSSPSGTTLQLSNTSAGGRFWSLTSGGSLTSEGAGRLHFGFGSNPGAGSTIFTLSPLGGIGILTSNPQDPIHLGAGAMRFPDGSRQSTAYAPIVANVALGSFTVPSGGENTRTFAVTGAQPGMMVVVTPPYDLWPFHSIGYARVISENLVRFSIVSGGGGQRTYSANTWRVTVIP
ncbi:MAG: hypothetical protein LAT64_10890 [Phycisphaerales bacterium]|nr:hypothetical protein [Planctomycetota bacterium]MCH8509256.1 hypothetical protein [Phycisphaerales bacterium]